MLTTSGCKKSEPVNNAEITRGQLTGTQWKLKSATIDDADHTISFAGFTLSFTSATYSTTNGGAVWPASGTWQFNDDTGRVITLSDIGDVEIVLISNSALVLRFNHDNSTFGPGRTNSISGVHRFDLIK